MTDVLGLFRVTSARTARRQDAERARLRTGLETVTADRDAARADLAAAARQRDAGLVALATLVTTDTAPGAAPADAGGDLVPDLITLADRLADLGTGAGMPDGSAPVVLRWVAGRVDALLTRLGVTVLRDDGPVDLARHEVVDARPAPSADLVDRVAATVRPGYLRHGGLLRPQQVVAYVPSPSDPNGAPS